MGFEFVLIGWGRPYPSSLRIILAVMGRQAWRGVPFCVHFIPTVHAVIMTTLFFPVSITRPQLADALWLTSSLRIAEGGDPYVPDTP